MEKNLKNIIKVFSSGNRKQKKILFMPHCWISPLINLHVTYFILPSLFNYYAFNYFIYVNIVQ